MSGWSRKVEVRDVVLLAALCALLGAVMSWLIFAWVGDPARAFGFGSLADWVAAGATGVVGYGANKYAAEAHRQRMDDRANRLLIEKRDAIGRLTTAIIPFLLPGHLVGKVQSFIGQPDHLRTYYMLSRVMPAFYRFAKEVEVSNEVYLLLPLEAVPVTADINSGVASFRELLSLLESTIKGRENVRDAIGETQVAILNMLLEQAKGIDERVTIFVGMTQSKREALADSTV